MVNFQLEGSDEYYLCLSDQPKRFDADSPATNVFFDDTNGQVFTVRSGGVTGVTVSSMDESKSISFRMEDRGPIISIKLSPDQSVLAIQRNKDNQNGTVEFVNFKDNAPTNVEYLHSCKWKNAKILGFVWPKANEIAFITDHGIELLQVIPEKKTLKSLKNVSFSGAWFQWCAQSNIVLLASNNGLLLQPFSLTNSTITKLQKLELEACGAVAERDAALVRALGTAWAAVFRHHHPPTEVWLMPISGAASQLTHVLKTGLSGRFAISVVDDLIVIHHQSSQSSQVFDLLERAPRAADTVTHLPAVGARPLRPAQLAEGPCPMYSGTWVMFQPDYVIDARLGCLWRVQLLPTGLAHQVPKDEISKIIALLLRRTDCKETIYRILRQLVEEAKTYLDILGSVFDEINTVYKAWSEQEVARNTAGQVSPPAPAAPFPAALISQQDVCTHVFHPKEDSPYIVQVVTAFLSSVCGCGGAAWGCTSEVLVRACVVGARGGRVRALARRGALAAGLPLACALLSLRGPHAQLALDMLARLGAGAEVLEVLLGGGAVVAAAGAARQAGAWRTTPARKLLAAARSAPPHHFVAVLHALLARNERTRGDPNFLKSEQCDAYLEYYKQIME